MSSTRAGSGCSRDQFLRKFGFTIYARPNNRQPVWIRKGLKFPQSEAISLAVLAEECGEGDEPGTMPKKK